MVLDGLAWAALVGFASLIAISVGVIWVFWKLAMKGPGEV